MVKLEIRYVPALRTLLPVPSLESCIAAVRKFGRTGEVQFSSDTFRFRFPTIKEAAEHCLHLSENLRTDSISIPVPEMFPFHAIAWDKQPPPPEMWRLAPPGHMLIPAALDFAGTSEWLYQWEIWCMSGENSVTDRLTPLRSLLVLGSMPKECFFCGSHHHLSHQCPAMWNPPIAAFTTGRLSDINPALWLEYIKKAGGRKNDVTEALDLLKQDMRKVFNWNFAARLCRSSAVHFNEFSASPLKSLDIYELKDLFEAVNRGNFGQIKTAINCSRTRSDTSALAIMRGFYYMAAGDVDMAKEEWWDAEREAGTPMRKCYAALLQSRLFFLTGDMPRALNSIARAAEEDPCPAVSYWTTILSTIGRGGSRISAAIHNMAGAPRLISAALAEPLLLRYQREIEDTFNGIWKNQEDLALKHVKGIETVLGQAERAFGAEVIKESAIRLRNWRGKWPQKGYRSLLSSEEFLSGLKNQVMKEVNRRFTETLSKFPGYEKRCRTILSRLPVRTSTKKVRSACMEVIRELRNVGAAGRARDIEKLAGFREEVSRIVERYEDVNRMYLKYMEKMWQKRITVKFFIYVTSLSIITWFGFYIYDLINM